MSDFQIAPSVLAADLADLGAAADFCNEHADVLHYDVMDGRFVPNLTFGIPVLRDLKRRSKVPIDVHLMVEDPDRLLDEYVDAGADWVSVHWEAATHVDRTAARIRELGAKAGVALNPATPVEVLRDVLPSLDFVVLMSVNPGFAGQPFLPYVLDKCVRLKNMIDERGLGTVIEMDGGLGPENVALAARAGVEVAVAGSALFGAADPGGAARAMRQAAEKETS